MAKKFPHVEITGVDLAPTNLDESAIPGNCRFEVDDVNRGLPRFYGQIDLIHVRSISSGVSPRPRLPTHLDLAGRFFSIIFDISSMQPGLKHLST